MNDLVISVRERVKKYALCVGYGHIGDGNLHLNIAVYDKNNVHIVEKLLEPYIFEILKQCKGSVSAEHGIGLMKAQYLNYTKSDLSIEYMKKIKDLFDPKGILNPYKIFPKT